jgi:hypothetical protein
MREAFSFLLPATESRLNFRCVAHVYVRSNSEQKEIPYLAEIAFLLNAFLPTEVLWASLTVFGGWVGQSYICPLANFLCLDPIGNYSKLQRKVLPGAVPSLRAPGG